MLRTTQSKVQTSVSVKSKSNGSLIGSALLRASTSSAKAAIAWFDG